MYSDKKTLVNQLPSFIDDYLIRAMSYHYIAITIAKR